MFREADREVLEEFNAKHHQEEKGPVSRDDFGNRAKHAKLLLGVAKYELCVIILIKM